MSDPVRVAMIGLVIGAEFIATYQAHPGAEVVALCPRNEVELAKSADQFGINMWYTNHDVLADPEIDFVHINSPISDHAWMSLKDLDAGKQVTCTVPMTINECLHIAEKIEVPDDADLLPESSRKFTPPLEIHDAEHLSFLQGDGDGGSHPHLVNEFDSALVEDRDPLPGAVTIANWTCVGIGARESAFVGGETVRLPELTLQANLKVMEATR